MLLYVISPIDFIPEAIFGPVGYLDDIGVVLLGMALFVKLCPTDIVADYLNQLEYGSLDDSNEAIDTTYRIVDKDK